jgi:aspartyl-tRNA(Asn)/glutamyl-tRNA(Gln) amidotransferase subunit C
VTERFSPDDVERLARLARLELAAGEKTLFARQLDAILRYAEQIQSVDTREVPAAEYASVPSTPLRDDEPGPSLPLADAVAGAPATDASAHLFKVPRVLG